MTAGAVVISAVAATAIIATAGVVMARRPAGCGGSGQGAGGDDVIAGEVFCDAYGAGRIAGCSGDIAERDGLVAARRDDQTVGAIAVFAVLGRDRRDAVGAVEGEFAVCGDIFECRGDVLALAAEHDHIQCTRVESNSAACPARGIERAAAGQTDIHRKVDTDAGAFGAKCRIVEDEVTVSGKTARCEGDVRAIIDRQRAADFVNAKADGRRGIDSEVAIRENLHGVGGEDWCRGGVRAVAGCDVERAVIADGETGHFGAVGAAEDGSDRGGGRAADVDFVVVGGKRSAAPVGGIEEVLRCCRSEIIGGVLNHGDQILLSGQ